MAKIHFNEKSFEGIIRSAYETLRVECIGILFGEKNIESLEWFVESIHPIQLAERKPDRVFLDWKKVIRGETGFTTEPIGSYHSHTMFRKNHIKKVIISEVDKESLKEYKNNQGIEVIIGVKEAKRTLIPNNPFIKTCYIRDEKNLYRFDVGGYYYFNRVRRAEIIVPQKLIKEFLIT